ncbi:FKBP-type peptidyl-prolyl cis-trans isomerase [Caulobacter sp. ErkDOM-E]|uniref:FKBP-type peptidyl-prolyl cis-trans isomerase n=1 Tax=Caulobacter sp. ErkDOM-E TaxID=3402778 RepID=UPI003AF831E2
MHRRTLLTLLTAGAAVSLAGCSNKKASENLLAADAFMAKNAKEPGVVTLPEGLQYKIVRSGPNGGMHPTRADEVKVHYEGKLIDGTIFDSSYERGAPASFPLDGLVPAWVIALQRMKAGDEWMLYVPPALGYGAEDKGPIPGNSVMIFRIELIDVLRAPTGTPKG